jgi:hypothetical protein
MRVDDRKVWSMDRGIFKVWKDRFVKKMGEIEVLWKISPRKWKC